MTKTRDLLAVFNRGLISKLAFARIDVRRVALSAETMTNVFPRVLGAMTFRPGMEYLGNFKSDSEGVYIPFVFNADDTALLEMTPSVMRVWDEGETLVTRNSVTATVANGTFDSDLASWTDDDETGAASTWATGGYMQLLGTRYEEARRYQAISITETTTEHALRIVVERGPVLIRIGTTAGADDIFTQRVLRTGTHSLAFTPNAATIYVTLASSLDYPTLIDSVSFEAAGTLELPTPWSTQQNLEDIRYDTIGDITFVACDCFQQRRIERRPNNSWSIVLYEANDGPFVGPNGDNIRLTPSAISGQITLTSSRSLFASTSVGQIFQLTSQGQLVESDVSSADSFSDSVRVTGVGVGRNITVDIAGTWSGTVSLQRSIGEEGNWVTVATYTTNTSTTYNDALDNTIAFYRIGIETGNYTSGTAELSLTAVVGSITGVVRITAYTSATSVTAIVLSQLGGTAATEVWQEGRWSDLNGWPTAVAEYEGRLCWAGRGRFNASVSDAFDSFDPDFEGVAAPIDRPFGSGAVDRINWLIPLQSLMAGSTTAEHSVRSTTRNEVLDSTNINIKPGSSEGSARLAAVMSNDNGYFIQRSGSRVYEMRYAIEGENYEPLDMTALVPEIGETSQFRRMAVQRQPDTRIWCVREDGTVAALIRDKAEDVLAWVEFETSGEIEDIIVLPGTVEDRVFMVVKRTVDGSTVRFHEKMARLDQVKGGSLNRQVDAGVFYSGAAASVTAAHLPNTEVRVWADGVDQGTFTTSSTGLVTSLGTFANYAVGLHFRGRYKSAKLAAETGLGPHMAQLGRIENISLILSDTHAQGLTYGPSFDELDAMPLVEDGADVDQTSIWDQYSGEMMEFDGDWDADNRICLEFNAPRPATVSGIVFNRKRSDRADGRIQRGRYP